MTDQEIVNLWKKIAEAKNERLALQQKMIDTLKSRIGLLEQKIEMLQQINGMRKEMLATLSIDFIAAKGNDENEWEVISVSPFERPDGE